MSKKGQTISFEMLMWIPRIVFLVLVILSTSGIIFAFIVTNVNVGDIESHILMHRLQYSPEGIVSYDLETGRVYPGVVDPGKLGSYDLQLSLDAGPRDLAARFVMSSLQSDEELALNYVNRETYFDWDVLAIASADPSVTGTGRKFAHPEVRYVYSGQPSKLETVVITPND